MCFSCLDTTLFPVNSCPLASIPLPSLPETLRKIILFLSIERALGKEISTIHPSFFLLHLPSAFSSSFSSSPLLLIQLPGHYSRPFIKVVASSRAKSVSCIVILFQGECWIFHRYLKTCFLNHGNSYTYCTLYTLRNNYCFMSILEMRRLWCRKVKLLSHDHTGGKLEVKSIQSGSRNHAVCHWVQGVTTVTRNKAGRRRNTQPLFFSSL